MARILASGMSGSIGSALLPALQQQGHEVTRLTRGAASGPNQIAWDPAKPLSPEAVSGFDQVIHLAGESIAGRWTDSKKARIRDSRVEGTRHLAEALAKASARPRVFLSASAIGFYGDRHDEVLTEDSGSGAGFLPEVCRDWEGATRSAAEAGIRTAQIRTGIVLSSTGGALQAMLPPFKLGLGGRMGSGRQWWSWIDIDDMVGAIQQILKDDRMRGPFNLTAPTPVTNAEFTKVLAKVLSRPANFPMPTFAAKLAFGQMGDELLLASQRVEPKKLLFNGYSFRYSDLRQSLQHVLGR
jgi:hypothetical protein